LAPVSWYRKILDAGGVIVLGRNLSRPMTARRKLKFQRKLMDRLKIEQYNLLPSDRLPDNIGDPKGLIRKI
jgi:hypothetical protein